MAFPHATLLIWTTLITLSAAKFQVTYDGLAASGVQTCIATSNFTSQSIILRQNCREAFSCIMANIPNEHQSILSSGSAILGFIPTVLLVLGSPNEDIMRIGARFPILALLLSVMSISKRPRTSQAQLGSTSNCVSLGPYGVVGIRDNKASSPSMGTLWIVAAHVIAAMGAALVTWQTIDLGRKGVVTWACWTDFYPVIWLVLALLHHILSAVSLRLSLRVQIPSKTREPDLVRNALFFWDLTSVDGNIESSRNRLVQWSKTGLELLNNSTYLYGTAIYSSLTMVSGHQAIKILVVYGTAAVSARLAAVWALEEIMGSKDP